MPYLPLMQKRATKPVVLRADLVDNSPMNDTTTLPPLPDRLSIDPRSPFHNADAFERDVGITLNGKEHLNVEEYCISEGWIKIPAGKSLDRKGQPMLIKLKGTVEAFYK